MKKEHDITLQLVRKTLNPNSLIRFEQPVDWDKVIKFAHQQGVLGICFDTLNLLPVESRPDKHSVSRWFGQVEFLKADNKQKFEVAKQLSLKFHDAGIRTTVLKGMAYGRYYKHPELRYSCDFDCYLNDFEKGNNIADQLGASVDRSEQKHSHILYKGVHIENHRECTGVSEKDFEQYLTKMLFKQECETIEGTVLEMPPLMFDALFCLYHAQTHLIVEDGIQLRHLADWVLIRKKLKDEALYDSCAIDCEKYGLKKFMVALNGIADLIEGKKQYKELTEGERLLWNDILKPHRAEKKPKGWLAVRLNILRQIYSNSWKYKLYTDSSSWKEISKYLMRYSKRCVGASNER